MRILIEKRIAELLSEAMKRGMQRPLLMTFITAKNHVLITRTPEHGSSEILFQEFGHEREDPNELPLYVVNELPIHIVLSDKVISVHGMVGQDSVVRWVN
jgi:hypothetical protein